MTIVTRFAPSPTGYLHIGGARTALFNYLFAKNQGGKFLLRIEDTDRERSTDAAINAIIDGMKWLQLEWDGDPVYQFAKAQRHKQIAEELLHRGKAYKCYLSVTELESLREQSRITGKPIESPWRDGKQTPPDNVQPVIRLKVPREGVLFFDDIVQGQINIAHETLDDLVLLRSDGTPTYMLAVVVDDHDMGVTHVIRGDDHLANTPKQILIYKAMSWDVPEFAHIPLIHGEDGAKLSKRHGALGVSAYKDMGYLADAMNNYLLRLGWSHGDDEIINMSKAIEWFNLQSIGKSPSRMDFKKLDNINSYYIKNMSNDALFELIKDKLNVTEKDHKIRILQAIELVKDRVKNLNELTEFLALFKTGYQAYISQENLDLLKNNLALYAEYLAFIKTQELWTKDQLLNATKLFVESKKIKMVEVANLIRIALTGHSQSPSIFDIMEILGKEEILSRMESYDK